jgi:hypothetical protein
MQDEVLPSEMAALFDSVVTAHAALRHGAALRLADHGLGQVYDLMDELEEDSSRMDEHDRGECFLPPSLIFGTTQAHRTL